jgi:hypothetical protein
LIVPVEVPLEPEVIVNQAALLLTAHGTPLPAVTAIDPVLPPIGDVAEVGFIVIEEPL